MNEDQHHLALLKLLDGRGNVSQRTLAEGVGMSASQVNRFLRELVERGLVEVVDPGVRPFAYRLTPDGRLHRRRLDHSHFRSVVGSYRQVESRIRSRLRKVHSEGARNVVLYGAGEVMEMAYPLALEVGLTVLAIVDDDEERHGECLDGVLVEGPGCMAARSPDAVIVTTFRHAGEILERLGHEEGGLKVVEL